MAASLQKVQRVPGCLATRSSLHGAEEGTNEPIGEEEGSLMMAGAVAMDRVASSDKESARWSKEGRPGEAPIMVDG